MAITRTPLVDDDGTGTTGTVLNNAWQNNLYNQIDAAIALGSPVQQNTSVTGTQNDFALTAGCGALVCLQASPVTFTGFSAGVTGQRLTVVNAGTGRIDLSNLSTGSVSANRLCNFVSSGATSLAPATATNAGGTATYVYISSGGWRLVAHEQGAWITPTFNAADYTGGAGTWTVAAGNVLSHRYRLSGRTLSLQVMLTSTSFSGSSDSMIIGTNSFGGYTPAATIYCPMGRLFYYGGTPGPVLGMAVMDGGTSRVRLMRADFAFHTVGSIDVSAPCSFDVT